MFCFWTSCVIMWHIAHFWAYSMLCITFGTPHKHSLNFYKKWILRGHVCRLRTKLVCFSLFWASKKCPSVPHLFELSYFSKRLLSLISERALLNPPICYVWLSCPFGLPSHWWCVSILKCLEYKHTRNFSYIYEWKYIQATLHLEQMSTFFSSQSASPISLSHYYD